MYINQKIAEDIFYIGVNDRLKQKFENIIPISHGVSYNSFLIVDEKVALIDTVDIAFGDIFIDKIQSQLGDKPIDYIIINHMEPDHSGSIRNIRKYYPNVTIVGNKKTLEMVNGYYGIDDNMLEIKDEEELVLGKHHLRFYLTPMVHWPETMMTYDEQEKVLFSGDAFGSFGTLDGGVLDSQINVDKYWNEMYLYYANVIGKYGSPVQKAFQKLTPLDIRIICSTHGPVWKENISKAVDIYDRLSRNEGKEGAVIVCGSMYGNTVQMAEVVAQGLVQGGIKNVIIHDICKTEDSYIVSDIFKYRGLIVGSATYCNELHPDIYSLLNKVEIRQIKNREYAYFGSYTWSSAAVKKLAEFGEKMKWRTVDFSVEEKMGLKENNYHSCLRLGEKMAELLKKPNN